MKKMFTEIVFKNSFAFQAAKSNCLLSSCTTVRNIFLCIIIKIIFAFLKRRYLPKMCLSL